MNLDDLRTWTTFGLVLWAAGLSVTVWLRKPGEDAGKAITSLRSEIDMRMSAQDQHITELRTHMTHMPTNDDLADLEGTVKALSAQMGMALEGINAIRLAQQQINTFMLNSKKP